MALYNMQIDGGNSFIITVSNILGSASAST